jgi:hypothetical protein
MIKLLQSGDYQLIETLEKDKILIFDKKQTFVWLSADEAGGMLVAAHTTQSNDHFLSLGTYRIYQVEHEPHLTDALHMELLVGEGVWQGYLLSIGLPDTQRSTSRFIPTKELISRP